jgi:hypothetical protein
MQVSANPSTLLKPDSSGEVALSERHFRQAQTLQESAQTWPGVAPGQA